MRDCAFLVADGQMRACIEGFLGRDRFHLSIGCGHFNFDPDEDMFVDAGNDPGVYTRAHEVLRPVTTTHQRAVVMLDNQWDGSPGPDKIAEDIHANLINNGWSGDRIAVIVIEPELDVWIWQDSPHVERALHHSSPPSLRQLLEKNGSWPRNKPKPDNPKELAQSILKQANQPLSAAMYRGLLSKVSVRHCTDPSFHALCNNLRAWFP